MSGVHKTRGGLFDLNVAYDEAKQIELARPVAITQPGEAPGQLDGLVVLDDGRLLVSSWADKAVYVAPCSPAIKCSFIRCDR